jgi:hypothetical protein
VMKLDDHADIKLQRQARLLRGRGSATHPAQSSIPPGETPGSGVVQRPP